MAVIVIAGVAARTHFHASQKTNKLAIQTVVVTKPNMCADNQQTQALIVNVTKRHMWACSGKKSVYDTPVVTGMEKLPADLTPRGTYQIYAKETNRYLAGSDSTGKWNDYVYYWMPFLDDQYGTYGFHDATWRIDSAFGNIDPNSDQASHGCVETSKVAAAWLYNWASIGTTVIVQS